MFSNAETSLLNARTLAAQVPVSTLGKIFNTTLEPLKSAKEVVERSVFTRLKSGALFPYWGKTGELHWCFFHAR